LLVWRDCVQAFGGYRPLKGAEKWSRDHYKKNENLQTQTHEDKFTDSKNAIVFYV